MVHVTGVIALWVVRNVGGAYTMWAAKRVESNEMQLFI